MVAAAEKGQQQRCCLQPCIPEAVIEHSSATSRQGMHGTTGQECSPVLQAPGEVLLHFPPVAGHSSGARQRTKAAGQDFSCSRQHGEQLQLLQHVL